MYTFRMELNHFTGSEVFLESVVKNVEFESAEEAKSKGLFNYTYFEVKRVGSGEPQDVGYFAYTPLPGCCGVVVSSNTYLEPTWRRSYISKAFAEFKDRVAKDLGYSCVIMTTQMHNIPAVKNMFKRGFVVAGTFTNKRTSNLLALGWKTL